MNVLRFVAMADVLSLASIVPFYMLNPPWQLASPTTALLVTVAVGNVLARWHLEEVKTIVERIENGETMLRYTTGLVEGGACELTDYAPGWVELTMFGPEPVLDPKQALALAVALKKFASEHDLKEAKL